MYTVRIVALAIVACLLPLLVNAQEHKAAAPPQANIALEVTRQGEILLRISAGELAELPRASLVTKDDGVEVRYEGVWMHEILQRAGLPSGERLRGQAMLLGVVAEASDGYAVLFTLAELDVAFREPHVLVADRLEGKALLAHQGPLRLVVGGDKRGARSVRMLSRLRVVAVDAPAR